MTNFFKIFGKPSRDNNISTNYSFKSSRNLFTVPLILMIFLFACEEDPTSIGINLLPTGDFENVSSTELTEFEFYTQFTDSIISRDTSFALLGWQMDPFFGSTQADFVTQLWLYSPWPRTGLVSIDSVFLSISVSGITGDIVGDNTINIYENDELLSEDSTYYVNRQVAVKQFLGSFTLPEGIKNDTVLTFRLPLYVAEVLLSDTTKLFISNEESDFRSFFKGLYFEYPQTGNYNMLRIGFNSNYSYIKVYYTDAASGTRSYNFTLNPSGIMYSRYLHDFDAADPGRKIKYINQPVLDTMSYVQSFEGVYTKILIPGLADLKDLMPITINKARIFLPVFLGDPVYNEEMVPTQVLMRYTDENGRKRYVPDYELGISFLDGTYNLLTNRYKFNIVNFVQQYLDGEIPEPVIELFLPSLTQSNLILSANGAQHSPRMEITYTDLR